MVSYSIDRHRCISRAQIKKVCRTGDVLRTQSTVDAVTVSLTHSGTQLARQGLDSLPEETDGTVTHVLATGPCETPVTDNDSSGFSESRSWPPMERRQLGRRALRSTPLLDLSE